MSSFSIHITQTIIDGCEGHQGTAHCPVDEALRATGFRFTHRHDQWVDFEDGEGIFHPLPNAAKKFIRKFDAHLPVFPCVIEFRIGERT